MYYVKRAREFDTNRVDFLPARWCGEKQRWPSAPPAEGQVLERSCGNMTWMAWTHYPKLDDIYIIGRRKGVGSSCLGWNIEIWWICDQQVSYHAKPKAACIEYLINVIVRLRSENWIKNARESLPRSTFIFLFCMKPQASNIAGCKHSSIHFFPSLYLIL